MLQNIHFYFILNAFYENVCAKSRQLEIHLLIQRNLPKTHAVSASFPPFQNSTTVLPSCLAYLFILMLLLQHNPNGDLPVVNELSVVSRLRNLPRVTTFLRIAQAVANWRYCFTWSKYVIINLLESVEMLFLRVMQLRKPIYAAWTSRFQNFEIGISELVMIVPEPPK